MKVYACDALWRAGDWLSPAFVSVDETGTIRAVDAQAPAGTTPEPVRGWVIPGMPNLHSHAFQRAMAGLGERASGDGDSFWTWREAMYRFLERLGPDEVEAIAAELYVEMLEAGYTAVGEFHYLHHAPDGRGYDNPVELAERVVAAAGERGHPPDPAAGAVRGERLRRLACRARPAPLRQRRRLAAGMPSSACRKTPGRCASASRRTACARLPRPSLPSASRRSRGSTRRRRSTSMSPSNAPRSTPASKRAARGPSPGCARTLRSTSAGAWCTRRTSTTPRSTPS